MPLKIRRLEIIIVSIVYVVFEINFLYVGMVANHNHISFGSLHRLAFGGVPYPKFIHPRLLWKSVDPSFQGR
jgi:hypothetical protein